MAKKYNPKEIEPEWQKKWQEDQTFKVDYDSKKKKYYVLNMFPYPSGAGLHVGHVSGYTFTDIIARYKRQRGFNVLHPMGWDSFGLPAEQYALRTGIHPVITTKKNIDTYRKQMKALGFSYDWSREFATSDPNYYKWTQWIFTKLYEKGLAYEDQMVVNYCQALGTVVSNEEIENGKTKEGGYPIVRKTLRQWMLKITEYAERLIEDLDLVDWPESLKLLQRNWIGKSNGALIRFTEEHTKEKITIFTVWPDTLFGTTFLVLAPEHPLVQSITTPEQKKSVDDYIKSIESKGDLERTDLNFIKTGVFTGAFAINPVNQEKIPIWIADYVLGHVGTAAVMGVPCHDERDFEFAKKFHLNTKVVLRPEDEHSENLESILKGECCYEEKEGVIINSSSSLLNLNGKNRIQAIKAVVKWLEQTHHGEGKTNYKLRDWLFSRQRYWGEPFPILHFADGTKRILEIDELPLIPPELHDYKPKETGESPLARATHWMEVIDPKTKKMAWRESNTMPQWAGSCWYYLRFCDPHNTDKAWDPIIEDYWMPVDLYMGGKEHAVLHLLYARFWHKVLYDCGLVKTVEPFQKYRYQGVVVAPSYKKKEGGYVEPEEVIEKGEHYFDKEENELTRLIEKMSKSKLNGTAPDDVIDEFGADALRIYVAFMAPFDKEKIWNTDAILGAFRFLNRFWEMVHSDQLSDVSSKKALQLGSKLVDGVTKDIELLHFNTAIAKMMEFLNDFTKLEHYPKEVIGWAIQCLHAFAPHIAAQIWNDLGFKKDLDSTDFPTINPAYLESDEIDYVVQVNGKHRGTLTFAKDCSQQELEEMIASKTQIKEKYLAAPIKKIIFVKNKLINFVV
jgi:leucyl-tRNA synthetase